MVRVSVCAAVVFAFSATGASGFGTISRLGQANEHGKITRIALRPFDLGRKTMNEIAGSRGRFGAVGAPDHPKRRLYNKSWAHCSAGDYLDIPGYPQSREAAQAILLKCRTWIFDNLKRAVDAAGALLDSQGRIRSSQIPRFLPCSYTGSSGRAKCNVLGALGVAFHAAQDFYAHSNWTDKWPAGGKDPANPPGLGVAARAPWLDPTNKTFPFPKGLISGCFKGLPEKRYCKGRVRHADLNKDTGAIDLKKGAAGAGKTPRGRRFGNFARAVRAAIADTRHKWTYFEKQVLYKYGPKRGKKIICAIRNDRPGGC